MTKIIAPENCGNSPKAFQLRDFNVAYAKQELQLMLDQLTDDITWHWVGEKTVTGKEEVAKELEAMMAQKVAEFTVQKILTHGKLGAADGTVTMQDGSSYGYCDVYVFSSAAKSAKIAEITSYVVQQ